MSVNTGVDDSLEDLNNEALVGEAVTAFSLDLEANFGAAFHLDFNEILHVKGNVALFFEASHDILLGIGGKIAA